MVRVHLFFSMVVSVACLRTCKNPTQWSDYKIPVVPATKYQYEGYECNGETKRLTYTVDSVKTKVLDAVAVFGTNFQTGTGVDRITSTMSDADIYHEVYVVGDIKMDYGAVALRKQVVVRVTETGYQGYILEDGLFKYKDGPFRILIGAQSAETTSRKVSLGSHKVCSDGVCGETICRKGIVNATHAVFNDAVYEIANVTIVIRFFGLEFINAAVNAVQWVQIYKILDALDVQDELNKNQIRSIALRVFGAALANYNNRVTIDALGDGTSFLINSLHSSLGAALLAAEADRNDIRKTIVDAMQEVHTTLSGQQQQLQVLARTVESIDPNAAVSLYEGKACPPLAARYAPPLQVRDCTQFVGRAIIPSPEKGYPIVQHYDVQGTIHHSENGCDVIPGYLTDSDPDKIKVMSQNDTHYLARSGTGVVVVLKTTKTISGTYKYSGLQLPENDIQKTLTLKDSITELEEAQILKNLGLSDKFKDLVDEAKLGPLAGIAGIFGALGISACFKCCACKGCSLKTLACLQSNSACIAVSTLFWPLEVIKNLLCIYPVRCCGRIQPLLGKICYYMWYGAAEE